VPGADELWGRLSATYCFRFFTKRKRIATQLNTLANPNFRKQAWIKFFSAIHAGSEGHLLTFAPENACPKDLLRLWPTCFQKRNPRYRGCLAIWSPQLFSPRCTSNSQTTPLMAHGIEGGGRLLRFRDVDLWNQVTKRGDLRKKSWIRGLEDLDLGLDRQRKKFGFGSTRSKNGFRLTVRFQKTKGLATLKISKSLMVQFMPSRDARTIKKNPEQRPNFIFYTLIIVPFGRLGQIEMSYEDASMFINISKPQKKRSSFGLLSSCQRPCTGRPWR